MPIPLGVLAVAGAGAAAAGDFQLIQSQVLSSSTTDIYFDSIPQTFTHLQVRISVRNTQNFTTAIRVRPNGDANLNYFTHRMGGSGSGTVSSNQTSDIGRLDTLITRSVATAGVFGVATMDLLDYTNTTKFKTFKALHGYSDPAQDGNQITLTSIQWRNTAAVNSLWLNCWDGAFAIGSRFSLYGIRG